MPGHPRGCDPPYDAADFRRRYPDGRVGADQHRADPALGRELLEGATAALLAEHEALLACT